ncbi:MAG: hypothetical protein P5702_16065 [Limnospira sp. PMC 1291.21]|nr:MULTISPECIES: hypothetical protein [unclassified Limnospira]MDT9226286.1 hypothetical protein [Limnospira sp. PMC 1279.21]MDT9306806.1 hypothetical protein [Limnospira sp. PMC 1291.21]
MRSHLATSPCGERIYGGINPNYITPQSDRQPPTPSPHPPLLPP